MTRLVVLDTETTGLSWEKGNRVVEIGCIELVERRPTGRQFHRYLNPDRDFEPGAQEVTGLTREFLVDKPRFHEIARELLDFIDGAELVIHNAAFDLGFLDHEFSRLEGSMVRVAERCRIEDTLLMARQRYPGQRNSLDALCKRLDVDNSARQLHGALLDAQLLAEVYLALTSGQGEIGFGESASSQASSAPSAAEVARQALVHGPRPVVVVTAVEAVAHEARLDLLEKTGRCVWRGLEAA